MVIMIEYILIFIIYQKIDITLYVIKGDKSYQAYLVR